MFVWVIDVDNSVVFMVVVIRNFFMFWIFLGCNLFDVWVGGECILEWYKLCEGLSFSVVVYIN